jgi:hypothetical protein
LICCSSCSCCSWGGHINQNTTLLSNFTMLSAYCIAPLHSALPGSFSRQPCPAAFSGSLARQPCPAALPGSLARQPCPAALPGSLARQPCPEALPGSLARQPCPAALPGSLFTAVGRHASLQKSEHFEPARVRKLNENSSLYRHRD